MIRITKKQNPANWYSKNRILNNKEVIGVTEDMINIDYFGLTSLIKPLNFFKLLDLSTLEHLEYLKDKSYYYILDWMRKKKPVGHPYLRILIPDEWFKGKSALQGFIKSNKGSIIVGHEGRHRTLTSYNLYGNKPIEVYLFFNDKNGQKIINEYIDNNFEYNLLNNGIYSEGFNNLVINPIDKIL